MRGDMVVNAGHIQITYCMDGFFALTAYIAAQKYKSHYADQQKQGKAAYQKIGCSVFFF